MLLESVQIYIKYMHKISWTEEEVNYIANLMYQQLKNQTFSSGRDKTSKYQKAFLLTQKGLPKERQKSHTFKQDLSGVAAIINDFFEDAINETPTSKPGDVLQLEGLFLTFAELLNDAANERNEAHLLQLARLDKSVQQLEGKVQAIYQLLQSRPTVQVQKSAPVKSKDAKVLHICVVGLLQSRERILEEKLQEFPVQLSFLSIDNQKSFPKQPCHDFVIVTKHSGHSQYERLQKIYGQKVCFVQGGFTNIQRKIQELLESE